MVIVWLAGIIASFILLLTQLKKEEGKIKSGDIVTDFVVSLFSWITFVIILVVMVDKKEKSK